MAKAETKTDKPRATTQAVARLAPSRMPLTPAIASEFEVTPADWRVLVDQIFPSAKTVEAVMMALSYCRARNLDIFKKPVHIVPMWSSVLGKMVETVWPGIAEIRTTASRTGEYCGIDAVEFGPMLKRKFTGTIEGQRGSQTIVKEVEFPEWASVVVYRLVHGQKCAYHAKVFWEETKATIGKTDVPNDMWAKRPRGQLDKCVEAAALRKAFPEELGSVFAAEEMEGRTVETVPSDIQVATVKADSEPPAPPAEEPPTPEPEDDDVVDVKPEDIFEPNVFAAMIITGIEKAETEDELIEFWEENDVDSRLDGTSELDDCYDARNKRLAQFDPEPTETVDEDGVVSDDDEPPLPGT